MKIIGTAQEIRAFARLAHHGALGSVIDTTEIFEVCGKRYLVEFLGEQIELVETPADSIEH